MSLYRVVGGFVIDDSCGWSIPTNAHGECSLFPVSTFDDGHLTVGEGAWAIQDLVRVAMFGGIEGLRVCMGAEAVVGVSHRDMNVRSRGHDEGDEGTVAQVCTSKRWSLVFAI